VGKNKISDGILRERERERERERKRAAQGTSFGDLSHALPGEVPLGIAPVDEGDEVAPTPLANLYLPALRLLLTVRCRWSSTCVYIRVTHGAHGVCIWVSLTVEMLAGTPLQVSRTRVSHRRAATGE